MDWREKCFTALKNEKMFEDSGHQTRFRELMDCYSRQPFFTKGLAKCVYLSSWDEEHFLIMLETLTDLSLGKETSTKEMSIKGDALAEEQMDDEYYVYQLSLAFLDGEPYSFPDPSVPVSDEIRYIISRALQTSEIIDRL